MTARNRLRYRRRPIEMSGSSETICQLVMNNPKVKAFFWDFDGTLVDSRQKNFEVMRAIVRDVAPEAARNPEVTIRDEYERCQGESSNWRDFYIRQLGFDEERTDRVGKLWTEYQLRDRSHVPALDGVLEVLSSLQRYPHAIVSQNAKSIILRALGALGLSQRFRPVVGYEEVPIRKQKPEPDGLLLCLEALRPEPGWILFVGDHPSDTLTARNANKILRLSGSPTRVVSIGAAYGAQKPLHTWRVQPDFIARRPGDVLEFQNRLDSGFSPPSVEAS